jgi:hypothetical protein
MQSGRGDASTRAGEHRLNTVKKFADAQNENWMFSIGRKSQTILLWWRRGELNPRPRKPAMKRLRAYPAQLIRATP